MNPSNHFSSIKLLQLKPPTYMSFGPLIIHRHTLQYFGLRLETNTRLLKYVEERIHETYLLCVFDSRFSLRETSNFQATRDHVGQ
jgi:hypothetical protein